MLALINYRLLQLYMFTYYKRWRVINTILESTVIKYDIAIDENFIYLFIDFSNASIRDVA